MRAGQTLYDEQGFQVALFPLSGFHVSQADNGTYSHGGGSVYWATDYLGWNSSGRVYRDKCYAPVDMRLLWFDASYPVAVWESQSTVHLANGEINYLTVLIYHDQDYANGVYHVGDIKLQGELFCKTGTMNHGSTVGDHVHLETGKGRYNLDYSTGSGTAEYKYHITDYTTVKRLHNYDALFINDTNPHQSPSYYKWKIFEGGTPSPTFYNKYKFKWVLYARRFREGKR